MTRTLTALAALLVAAAPALCQQTRPLGTWTRTTTVDKDEAKIKLDFKEDELRCTIRLESGYSVTVYADYLVTPDGLILGAVRTGGVRKKEGEDETEKRFFYCRCKMEKNALVISEVSGGHNTEEFKKMFEGSYRHTVTRSATSGRRPQYPTPVTSY